VSNDQITITLADGRKIAAPLAWSPRLADATPAQRNNWRLIGRGQAIPLAGRRRRHFGGEPAESRFRGGG